MLDYATLLHDPAYTIWGVAAALTTTADPSVTHDLTVIDKTAGIEVGTDDGQGGTVLTIRPAAIVRMAELTAKGLTRAGIRKVALTMHGKTWRIENTLPKPVPSGEADGELVLLLIET